MPLDDTALFDRAAAKASIVLVQSVLDAAEDLRSQRPTDAAVLDCCAGRVIRDVAALRERLLGFAAYDEAEGRALAQIMERVASDLSGILSHTGCLPRGHHTRGGIHRSAIVLRDLARHVVRNPISLDERWGVAVTVRGDKSIPDGAKAWVSRWNTDNGSDRIAVRWKGAQAEKWVRSDRLSNWRPAFLPATARGKVATYPMKEAAAAAIPERFRTPSPGVPEAA